MNIRYPIYEGVYRILTFKLTFYICQLFLIYKGMKPIFCIFLLNFNIALISTPKESIFINS